jgi:hypothetical protein
MTTEESKTTICRNCGITPICFDPNQRIEKGILIPLVVATHKLHKCPISKPFRCDWCGQTLYLDKKVLSPSGKRIPLDYNTETYHNCPKKERPASELRYFKKRGLFAD